MIEFLTNPAFQLTVVLAFWASVAATEGWKWRQNDGKPDNSKIVTWNSYHIWRIVTTASFLLAPFTIHSMPSFLLANAIGWLVYERVMSLVEYDAILYKRPEFHLVDKVWFKRPKPIVEVYTIVVLSLLYAVTGC